jgi:hypothetical protein
VKRLRHYLNDQGGVDTVVQVELARGTISSDLFPGDSITFSFRNYVEGWMNLTELGQWCKEKCLATDVLSEKDFLTLNFKVLLTAELLEKDYTFFLLKWGDNTASNELFGDERIWQ